MSPGCFGLCKVKLQSGSLETEIGTNANKIFGTGEIYYFVSANETPFLIDDKYSNIICTSEVS